MVRSNRYSEKGGTILWKMNFKFVASNWVWINPCQFKRNVSDV
jgi:hypothetical protein